MSLGPEIQHYVKSDWALIERAGRSSVVTNSNKNFWQPIASGSSPTMYRRRQIIPRFFLRFSCKKVETQDELELNYDPLYKFSPFCSLLQLQLSELGGSSLVWVTVQCRQVQARLEAASCTATPLGDDYWQLSPPLRLGTYTGAELGTTCCYDSG